MQVLAYVVLCADGRRITLDRAVAVQYAADHGGTVHDLVLAGADEARLDWLTLHPHELVNALIGDLDSDVLCVGSLPGTGPLNVRGLIDKLRHV